MEKKCIICGSSAPKLTDSARISAFRQASNQRGDDLAERLADDATTFWCHKNCMSTYCSPDHIQRLLKKRTESENPDSSEWSSKRLRSSTEGSFNFREHCLFCGEECQVIRPRKNPNRWREAYLCRTADREGQISFTESVLRHAKGEMITGEMMLHLQQTLPSVTCMLLMLGTIKTACQSFSLITPLHLLWLSMMQLQKNSRNSFTVILQEFGTVWNYINSMKIWVEKCCHAFTY